MMEYLYTGRIQHFNPSVALDLLGLAECYNLEGLKQLCENTLIHNVDTDNLCALLIDAHRFSATELKKYCMGYLLKNFNDVNKTKGFEALEKFPNLLMEVLKQVATNVDYKDS